jgi:hypothetical protein
MLLKVFQYQSMGDLQAQVMSNPSGVCHSCPNSTPTGEKGKQTDTLVHRNAGSWTQQKRLP